MTKYLIIDDESIAHQIIQDYCNLLPNMELAKNCYDAIDALDYLRVHKVDLIFLDINMPKLKGFDFLKTLANPRQVIVTTAYLEYALEGYELNVVDYLLKPFSFERFVAAVNKANQAPHVLVQTPNISFKEQQVFLYSDKKHIQIKLEDVLFVEAAGNYAKVVLKDQSILIREKLSNVSSILPQLSFIQVHKSFLVATSKINLVQGNQITIAQYKIPIGKMFKERVLSLL